MDTSDSDPRVMIISGDRDGNPVRPSADTLLPSTSALRNLLTPTNTERKIGEYLDQLLGGTSAPVDMCVVARAVDLDTLLKTCSLLRLGLQDIVTSRDEAADERLKAEAAATARHDRLMQSFHRLRDSLAEAWTALDWRGPRCAEVTLAHAIREALEREGGDPRPRIAKLETELRNARRASDDWAMRANRATVDRNRIAEELEELRQIIAAAWAVLGQPDAGQEDRTLAGTIDALAIKRDEAADERDEAREQRDEARREIREAQRVIQILTRVINRTEGEQ